MHVPTDVPSISSSVIYPDTRQKTANLDDLPAPSQLILELLLHARDHSRIVALLAAVLGANDDFARLAIPEQENFLRRERDHVHGRVILQEATRANVHLPDIKHF